MNRMIAYFAMVVVFIQFMLALFTFYSLQGLAISIPGVQTVQSYQVSMTNATTAIATALAPVTTQPNTCSTGDGTISSLGCVAYNAIVALWNIINGIYTILINIIILIILGITISILILFIVLPNLFTTLNLGFLNAILAIVDGAVLLIAAFYGYEIITDLLERLSNALARK